LRRIEDWYVRPRSIAGLLAFLLGVGVFAYAAEQPGHPVFANGQVRLIVPGIAADSVPGIAVPTATASPTTTPPPGGGSPSPEQLWVALRISVQAQDLSFEPDGTTLVAMYASVDAPIPAIAAPPASTPGIFIITPHPPDAVPCTWDRTMSQPNFAMTLVDVATDLSTVHMEMLAPEWFYTVTCPSPAPPLRVPAFGAESLFLYLQFVAAPYRFGDGVKLPMQAASTTDGCVKRQASFAKDTPPFGHAEFHVFIYQKDRPGGCTLPPGLPVPPPTPTPAPP